MQDNGFGLGDMTLGAFAQFEPLTTAEHRPVFAHRADFGVIAPTGKYDASKQVNPGTNTWAINPSWAATLMPVPRLEISTRFNYLINFQNSNPGGGLQSTRAGQAIFDNFAVAFEILPYNPERTAAHSLRAGVNGYYFKQISESEVNGATQPGLEQALGIGPGAMWVPTLSDAFWLNVYVETAVQNRFASNVVQGRWARTF
jgi:hypothetical protein